MERPLLMLRRVLLAAALSIGGGCYSPSIDACQLACAANNVCPDGLTCNAQGVCAASATDTCATIDGGDSEDPRAVSVLVLDQRGELATDALVVFVDGEGTEVAEIVTGVDGRASAVIGENGTVTVIRMINLGTVEVLGATTFISPPEGARLISQHAPNTVETPRTVNFPAPPAGQNLPTIVASSCAPSRVEVAAGQQSAVIQVRDHCDSADYVVASKPPPGAIPPYVRFAPERSGNVITVDGTPSNMQPFMLRYQPVPPAASGTVVGGDISAFLSMDSAPVRNISSGVVDATMGVSMYAPIQTPIASTLRFESSNPNGTAYQDVHQRHSAGTKDHGTNLIGTLVPYPVMPSLDLAGHRLSWTELGPGVNPPGAIDGALITLAYRRGTSGLTWRIVVPVGKLGLQGTVRTLALPDLPGDRVFEPVDGDVLVAGDIKTFNVPDGAASGVLSSLEVLDNNDRMFTVPAVDGYVVTRTQLRP